MTTENRRTLTVGELNANIDDTIAHIADTDDRIIVTRHGKPAVALISAEDLAMFEELEDAAGCIAMREAKAEDDGTRYTLAEVNVMLGFDD